MAHELHKDRWVEAMTDTQMSGQQLTTTYVIRRPHGEALKLVKTGLAEEGLRIAMEIDVSGMIRRELGLHWSPCRILGVCCPLLMLEAVVMDAGAPVYLPLHLVVSGSDTETLVRLGDARSWDNGVPKALEIPVGRMAARIRKALERIGARQAVYQFAV